MEFDFNINTTFTNKITKLDRRMKLVKTDRHDETQHKDQVCIVINKLGMASSKAQGLRIPVTSISKLKDSDHYIYLLKDEHNRNPGAAIGFLKVGSKTLFVYDSSGVIHELVPMCVLDFYIHESRQRQGFGKELFDYMLQDTGLSPAKLAIDKPSYKFISFLKKHYNLIHSIPQTNNFVIFHGFFSEPKKDNTTNNSQETNDIDLELALSCRKIRDKDRITVKGGYMANPSAQNSQPFVNPPHNFPESKVLPSITSSKQLSPEMKSSPKESPVSEATESRPTLQRTTTLTLSEEPRMYLSSAPSHWMPAGEFGSRNNNAVGTHEDVIGECGGVGGSSGGGGVGGSSGGGGVGGSSGGGGSGRQRSKINPLKITDCDPLNLNTNNCCYPKQHEKLLPYMESSKIRLPYIEQNTSSNFQHNSSFLNKQTTNDADWSLFNNVAKYHSLVKRGYSHTHIW